MKFVDLYLSNLKAVKSGLKSLWCSESVSVSAKQIGYAKQLQQLIDNELFASEDYEPLVQSMELYEAATKEEAESIFKVINKKIWDKCTNGKVFLPYKHQIKAWESLTNEECRSMVVTTGTGSGKTECFMVPLVNDLSSNNNEQNGFHSVKAIFLYPLNALMEDQKDRLQRLLAGTNLKFAVYNGNLPDSKNSKNENLLENERKNYSNIIPTRADLHKDGADIILTNPTMLEYMLIRDKDQHLFEHDSLKWIVVDEAHTFTGAAAAELAMLLRRLLNAFGTDTDNLHFAASSATIGNGQNKLNQEKTLRKFISDISGIKESKIDVIPGNRIKYSPQVNEDEEFLRCKRILTNSTCDYVKLSELFPTPQYKNIQERLSKLDELCEKGLRAKVHYFYRVPNNGIKIQLDQWEDRAKGLLKLQSITPSNSDATPALEIARCAHCGEYFAIGDVNPNDPNHYYASTDSDNDSFDFYEEKSNKVFFGVVPANSPRTIGNEYVEISGNEYKIANTTDEWQIVINTDRNCPHCAASLYPSKKKSGNVISKEEEDETNFKATRLRVSSEYIARLMAPGLLDEMTPNGDNNPHHGQQYISFVDSRQAAAKGTFNQNVEVEKMWVYSRVYHELLKKAAERDVVIKRQQLAQQYNEAMTNKDPEVFVLFKEFLNNIASHDHDYITWQEIYHLLEKDENGNICDQLCRQFANRTDGREIDENGEVNPVIKQRYIYAVMLSNLAKYPPFQASAETMGLFESYYPKLEKITELPDAVVAFNEKYNTKIDVTEWKKLLKIYIDRTPRSNESIYLKVDNNYQCDIFNCSERFGLSRPPHRTVRKPILNDKCNNASLIPYLLAKLIKPDSDNLLDVLRQDRECINKVIEALWKGLIDCGLLQYSQKIKSKEVGRVCDGSIAAEQWDFDRDSKDDVAEVPTYQQNEGGKQFRLNVVDIAFRLPSQVYYTEIPEKGGRVHIRPTYTTFCGYSPYMDYDSETGKVIRMPSKPIASEDWKQPFEYQNGKIQNEQKVDFGTIEGWMRDHRPKMYAYGLMGETGCFNNRILSVLSYPQPFIQAEHTAQVDKQLSKITQESFKHHKINILACSTTMEMGVDLGDLELVLMSSIPPHPANYKQRAGRSGRNNLNRSACITLCSSDAVGYRILRDPMQNIIQRSVSMPFVDLDCPAIIQRHVNAFLYRQSGCFFSTNYRSSLNWSLIDIFTNYIFGTNRSYDKNGNQRTYTDYWTVLDVADANGNRQSIYPMSNHPLGQTIGTKYEAFYNWLKDNAHPNDIQFLLKGTTLQGCENQVIDECMDKWCKLYNEIENELAYYGRLYEQAVEKAKDKGEKDGKQYIINGKLDTSYGDLLRAKFNSILKKSLVEYLATHRFTPNANMPVDVVELDVNHNKKSFNSGSELKDNPSYSLVQALSQYAPGNMIVKENRIISVAGIEYFGKDSAFEPIKFKTDGIDVYRVGSQQTIDPTKERDWPINGKKELELIGIKSFIPDINAQDSRVLQPSPYTRVNAYLIGAESWQPSDSHLMSARCNLDVGDAKILYHNEGIGFGYCLCPKCGKTVMETAPVGNGTRKNLPSEMVINDKNGKQKFHTPIDKLDKTECVPPNGKFYRNVILGGLIQTDFCEMIIRKQDGAPANKATDKALLSTLGLVLCRAFTEYIGKERESVDFIVMNNAHLCVFDTNPGGSGYSNKLSDNNIRIEVLKIAQIMLNNAKSKEELLDKFTIRYINDVDIENTREWVKAELESWTNIPDKIRQSYANANWSGIVDIIKAFQYASDRGESGMLFCRDDFEKWNYSSSDPEFVRQTWSNRIREIIKAYATGVPKVNLVIQTEKSTIPTVARTMLPQNSWANICTTSYNMGGNYWPLAVVNGELYFTDSKDAASMNGDWAKGNVFVISIEDKNNLFDVREINFNSSTTNTCVFELNEQENLECNSKTLAQIVLELAKRNGLDVNGFFDYCKHNRGKINITYMDEHLKCVIGMITTMHFIEEILNCVGDVSDFHLEFINEKYYAATAEVSKPWFNIEKWERRNEFMRKIVNHWIETKYKKTSEEAIIMWKNSTREEKALPHWRILSIKCGNKMMNIYPHGGIINEWRVNMKADPNRYYTMDENTDLPIPLIRENPIMYIVEIVEG